MIKLSRLLVFASALLGFSAHAMFLPPQFVPIQRLLENLEPYLQKKPNDVSLNYTKARIHYLAFIYQFEAVSAFQYQDEPPQTVPDWMLGRSTEDPIRALHARDLALQELGVDSDAALQPEQLDEFSNRVIMHDKALKKRGWKPSRLDLRTLKQHALSAYHGFTKTLKLDPQNGLVQLGLASFMDQYLRIVADRPDLKVPELNRITRNRIVDRYFQAYTVSINDHLQLKYWPMEGIHSLASYEAGNAFVRVVESNPRDLRNIKNYRIKLASVKANLAKLNQIPRGAITPLIFALQPHPSVDALVNWETRVAFDLSGFGLAQTWPWVKPSTGLLVWDPSKRGEIISGQDLFGNYTWRIFWDNGFAALQTLDDNLDGWLTDSELLGIRVWFDHNTNTVSEPGELEDLASLGIQALAVQPDGAEGPHLLHSKGLRLTDGTSLPLWDWVVSPH